MENSVTLIEFFKQIQADATIARANIPLMEFHKPNEFIHPLDIVIGHANMLVLQASGGKVVRRQSIIRSSWYTVSKFGKKWGLFEKSKGWSELRDEVVQFLNVPDDV